MYLNKLKQKEVSFDVVLESEEKIIEIESLANNQFNGWEGSF